ncbi:MAG: hypothetical protein KIT17_03725 [Rubrivivax sp.]|nr:hypothetical protein [Rubrivivax sp.]
MTCLLSITMCAFAAAAQAGQGVAIAGLEPDRLRMNDAAPPGAGAS